MHVQVNILKLEVVVLVSEQHSADVFQTAGPDDPRIQEAITRCQAAGHTVTVYNQS